MFHTQPDTGLPSLLALFAIHIMLISFQSAAAYLYDDLHSLDNDSFLTSLETISEKDRFNWE